MIATGMSCMSLDFSIFIEQCKDGIGATRITIPSILVSPVHIYVITEEWISTKIDGKGCTWIRRVVGWNPWYSVCKLPTGMASHHHSNSYDTM